MNHEGMRSLGFLSSLKVAKKEGPACVFLTAFLVSDMNDIQITSSGLRVQNTYEFRGGKIGRAILEHFCPETVHILEEEMAAGPFDIPEEFLWR